MNALLHMISEYPWVLVVPLISCVLFSVKMAYVFSRYKKRFFYIAGGYLVDKSRPTGSKLGFFVVNVLVMYIAAATVVLWVKWGNP